MPAKKSIRGLKNYADLTNGKYEIGYRKDGGAWQVIYETGYRKDGGAWQVINELEVTVPANRKMTVDVKLEGTEEDA